MNFDYHAVASAATAAIPLAAGAAGLAILYCAKKALALAPHTCWLGCLCLRLEELQRLSFLSQSEKVSF